MAVEHGEECVEELGRERYEDELEEELAYQSSSENNDEYLGKWMIFVSCLFPLTLFLLLTVAELAFVAALGALEAAATGTELPPDSPPRPPSHPSPRQYKFLVVLTLGCRLCLSARKREEWVSVSSSRAAAEEKGADSPASGKLEARVIEGSDSADAKAELGVFNGTEAGK
ncbi:hypothetical protein CPC08DRAFT_754029 [Agrocybe pediades]|nr:hypothetical protein CPC08DRAFT_754029 [Agrocybe pediades]